jgi:CheY-like chemotaxis protein
VSSHILVVEDNALVSGALRVLFEATGHRFSEAGTVAEALRVCTEDPPDVMFLDLRLPDGDGLEIIARLRSKGVAMPLTAVLTGRDDPGLAAQCRALGCREVLLKPVAPRVLLAKITEWTKNQVPNGP